MFSVTNHQGTANQNRNDISPHIHQNSYYQQNSKQVSLRMQRNQKLCILYISPYDTAIPHLYRPKRIKAGSQRDVCTPMFIGLSFTITKTWKKPTVHQYMDERAKHDIYIALNKKEILQYATTCMNLKDIMLNEVSYSQKDKHCVIPLTRDAQNS